MRRPPASLTSCARGLETLLAAQRDQAIERGQQRCDAIVEIADTALLIGIGGGQGTQALHVLVERGERALVGTEVALVAGDQVAARAGLRIDQPPLHLLQRHAHLQRVLDRAEGVDEAAERLVGQRGDRRQHQQDGTEAGEYLGLDRH